MDLKFVFVVLVFALASTVFSQIIIIEYVSPPGTCTAYGDCAPRVCNTTSGNCGSCINNPSQCPTGYCNSVTGNCEFCTSSTQCPSNLCVDGYCKTCASNDECITTTGFCSAGFCAPCTNNSQCSTRRCSGGKCVSCEKDEQCDAPFGTCALGAAPWLGVCKSCGPPDNAGCMYNYNCDTTTGKCKCKVLGEGCISSDECCNKKCRSGVCAQCILDIDCPSGSVCELGNCVCDPKDPVCLGVLGQDASREKVSYSRTTSIVGSPGGTPTEVKVETERRTVAPILIEIFGWAKKKVEALRTCIRGAKCETSEDCCGAPCKDGYCLCSTTACATSGDCCTGYCEGGNCVSPPTMTLFFSEVMKRPIVEVGCTGLIEECFPGEKGCIYLCNALTGFLALVAVGVGGITWKEMRHPVPGLFGGAIPIFIGVISYPFVGVITGLLIIGALSSR